MALFSKKYRVTVEPGIGVFYFWTLKNASSFADVYDASVTDLAGHVLYSSGREDMHQDADPADGPKTDW